MKNINRSMMMSSLVGVVVIVIAGGVYFIYAEGDSAFVHSRVKE